MAPEDPPPAVRAAPACGSRIRPCDAVAPRSAGGQSAARPPKGSRCAPPGASSAWSAAAPARDRRPAPKPACGKPPAHSTGRLRGRGGFPSLMLRAHHIGVDRLPQPVLQQRAGENPLQLPVPPLQFLQPFCLGDVHHVQFALSAMGRLFGEVTVPADLLGVSAAVGLPHGADFPAAVARMPFISYVARGRLRLTLPADPGTAVASKGKSAAVRNTSGFPCSSGAAVGRI